MHKFRTKTEFIIGLSSVKCRILKCQTDYRIKVVNNVAFLVVSSGTRLFKRVQHLTERGLTLKGVQPRKTKSMWKRPLTYAILQEIFSSIELVGHQNTKQIFWFYDIDVSSKRLIFSFFTGRNWVVSMG